VVGGARDAMRQLARLIFPQLVADELADLILEPTNRPPSGWA